jgi:hypothetical protein
MKTPTNSLIFGIAIIISSIFLGKAYVDRSKVSGEIQVTGLGEQNFTSDLIVWDGTFMAEHYDLKRAYLNLENDKTIIKNYLISKGVAEERLVFGAVNFREKTRSKYSPKGDFMGEEFVGYELTHPYKSNPMRWKKLKKSPERLPNCLTKE